MWPGTPLQVFKAGEGISKGVPNGVTRSGAPLQFGAFRLDPVRRVLWRGDELLHVPPRSVEILTALAERPLEVVSKEELLSRVWPDTYVEEANLSVNVSGLRRVLGAQPDGRPYIQTVHRRGYRFLAQTRSERRAGPPVLAVLPFTGLGDGADPALGAAMADAVIARLGGTGRVLVRPTSAILKYAGAPDPAAAGRELQADAVVSGTLQRDGGRLRVRVQLVPLDSSLPAWNASFDEAYTRLFDVQDKVAERVASALVPGISGEELHARPTADLGAYEAYARGRHFWSQFSAESLAKALGAFQEAAEKDASFAAPHAGLADLYLVSGFSGLLPPRDAWSLAEGAARRALALDADVAQAHVALAYVRLFADWDWPAAEAGLAKAVALAPRSAEAHQWQGLFHAMRGDLDAFEAAFVRARALDPVSLVVGALEAFHALLAGDLARELERCRRAVELDPHHFVAQWSLGIACLNSGLVEQAVRAHRLALEQAGDAPLLKLVLARTLAAAGRKGEARKLLAQLKALPHASAYQRATVHEALGEPKRALDALEAAAEARDPWLVWVRVDPMLRSLRREPRFKKIVRKVFGADAARGRRVRSRDRRSGRRRPRSRR